MPGTSGFDVEMRHGFDVFDLDDCDSDSFARGNIPGPPLDAINVRDAADRSHGLPGGGGYCMAATARQRSTPRVRSSGTDHAPTAPMSRIGADARPDRSRPDGTIAAVCVRSRHACAPDRCERQGVCSMSTQTTSKTSREAFGDRGIGKR